MHAKTYSQTNTVNIKCFRQCSDGGGGINSMPAPPSRTGHRCIQLTQESAGIPHIFRSPDPHIQAGSQWYVMTTTTTWRSLILTSCWATILFGFGACCCRWYTATQFVNQIFYNVTMYIFHLRPFLWQLVLHRPHYGKVQESVLTCSDHENLISQIKPDSCYSTQKMRSILIDLWQTASSSFQSFAQIKCHSKLLAVNNRISRLKLCK